MRVAAVLAPVAAAAACGLSVTGQEPIAPVDAGSSSSSSSSSSSGGPVEAGVDAGVPISCADFAGDSTVKRCLDFDDGNDGGKYGFDDLNFDGPLKPALSFEPSPLGDGAKQGFALNFFGDNGTAQKRDLFATITYPEFGAGKYTHVEMDVDVTVDRLDDFAWLAGLHFTGDGCEERGGLVVNKDRQVLHLESPGAESRMIGTYQLGTPFHIHIEANPGSTIEKPFSVSLNRGTPDAFQNALPYPACNYGAAEIGNFYASVGANDSFHFRFDQLVLRGTP